MEKVAELVRGISAKEDIRRALKFATVEELRAWLVAQGLLGDFSQSKKERCISAVVEVLMLDRAVKKVF